MKISPAENFKQFKKIPAFIKLENHSMNNDTLIHETAAILRQGKTILYPTDTIWGLGCDATNVAAVQRIFEIKQRSPEKAFILLVDSIEMLKRYTKNIHPRVETLLAHHIRPLTLIYKDAQNLPPICQSQDLSVGIRIAADPFCQKLISKFGRPIISTSANKSNEETPKFYNQISNYIKEEVDFIVDYRKDDITPKEPSIIASFDKNGELILIRS